MNDGYPEEFDEPKLPQGCWDEDTVDRVKRAVAALANERVYENGRMSLGVSVRLLARITMLQWEVGLLTEVDKRFLKDAIKVLRES